MVGGMRAYTVTESLSSHLHDIHMQELLLAHVQISVRIVKCLQKSARYNTQHTHTRGEEMVLLLSAWTVS